MRWIHSWLGNNMSMDLLGEVPVDDIHGPTIRTLKTSTCNAYMRIHFHRMMAFFRFFRFLYICKFVSN